MNLVMSESSRGKHYCRDVHWLFTADPFIHLTLTTGLHYLFVHPFILFFLQISNVKRFQAYPSQKHILNTVSETRHCSLHTPFSRYTIENGVQHIINAPTIILTVLAALRSDTNLQKIQTNSLHWKALQHKSIWMFQVYSGTYTGIQTK